MAFTDAPRNLDQGVLCVVYANGTNAEANVRTAGILTANRLLEKQAADALGEKLWVNTVKPLI